MTADDARDEAGSSAADRFTYGPGDLYIAPEHRSKHFGAADAEVAEYYERGVAEGRIPDNLAALRAESPARAAGAVSIAGSDVARVGYGMGSLARRTAERPAETATSVGLLRHALALGVTFFDTAEFYERGLANRLLAEAFSGRRDEVFLTTKVGARPVDGPVPMTAAQRPAELREAVHANLASLDTDRLDLVYLRRMDMRPGLVVDDADQRVDLDDQLAELVALRDAGLVGAIGLSHVDVDQLERALPAGIAAVSDIYNLLDRTHEPLLRVAEAHGIAWAPYFPLGGGGWADLPRVTDDAEVRRIAADLEVTPNQVGLAWLLARSPQSIAIAGTSSIGHLDENVAAASVRLSDADLRALDRRPVG